MIVLISVMFVVMLILTDVFPLLLNGLMVVFVFWFWDGGAGGWEEIVFTVYYSCELVISNKSNLVHIYTHIYNGRAYMCIDNLKTFFFSIYFCS